MTKAQAETGRSGQRVQFTGRRGMVTVIGFAMLLSVPSAPTRSDAMGRLLPLPHDPGIIITCSNPVMKSAPTFLSVPKGSAKYPFTSYCTSPTVPGGMTLRWEGSWTPSETRTDRPNASESITITAYDGFMPSREPGGKIFMYWTAHCDGDPWLQVSTCDRFGAYVPPDVREALGSIDHERFPLTWKSLSPSLKQQLVQQYQAMNQPMPPQQRNQNMAIQLPQQSQIMTQAQRAQAMTVQPQMGLPKPNTAPSSLSRSGVFARGVDEQEGQASAQQDKIPPTESGETAAMAVLEEGTPDIAEPAFLTLDRPLHATNAKGDAVVLKPGVYEIEAVMDVQLGLAREGQPTVLLHGKRGTHSESITRTIALVIMGQSVADVHLIFLRPDGTQLEAVGSTSGVKSRGTDLVAALPDKVIKNAVAGASAKPRSVSSPACQPNPADTGPRWIPMPCTMPVVDHP